MIAATYKCGCPPEKNSRIPPSILPPSRYSSNLPPPLSCCPVSSAPPSSSFPPCSPIQPALQSRRNSSSNLRCEPPVPEAPRCGIPRQPRHDRPQCCSPPAASSASRHPQYLPPSARPPFYVPPPPPFVSRKDADKCTCPRPDDRKHKKMGGVCAPTCAGVTEYTPNKIVSEIATKGLPYKEIEAVINDNRMVIRVQKEPTESEWDPPCDCDDPISQKEGMVGGSLAENVVYRQVDTAEMCSRLNDRQEGQSRDQSGTGCRTVTVFPQPITTSSPSADQAVEDSHDKKDKNHKAETRGSKVIDLEANPNIFVLRIRKKCENGDRKNNLDVEFRTPRPWLPRPKSPPKVEPPAEPPAPPAEDKEKGKKGKKGKK